MCNDGCQGYCGNGVCKDSCIGGCYSYCTGSCETSCSGGCGGCDGSCGGSCTGTCTNGCSDKCTNTCKNKCNTQCVGEVAAQAYDALLNGLSEYITEQDINNIYLIFKAIKDRRTDAGKTTSFIDLSITQDTNPIDEADIKTIITNASNTTSVEVNNIDQTSLEENTIIIQTPIEQLRQVAIDGYKNQSNYPIK